MANLLEPAGCDAVELARGICATRRRRVRHLPAHLLGEPAWDILLDLLVSKADGRSVAINSACMASGVPSSTATRCIKALAASGLVVQGPDAKDRRRRILTLTAEGEESVRRTLVDAHRVLQPAVEFRCVEPMLIPAEASRADPDR